jgi:hypothetical protein
MVAAGIIVLFGSLRQMCLQIINASCLAGTMELEKMQAKHWLFATKYTDTHTKGMFDEKAKTATN